MQTGTHAHIQDYCIVASDDTQYDNIRLHTSLEIDYFNSVPLTARKVYLYQLSLMYG
jgi:hypothetical protein